MKKNEYAPYVLFFYIFLIIVYFFSCGCIYGKYVGDGYIKCPTNNKTFFYQRNRIKPSKQFLKFAR